MNAESESTHPRLLYIITDLHIGGVPLHLLRLARHVAGSGYDVQVVSLAPPGPVTEMLNDAGIQTHNCAAKTALDFRSLLRLRRILLEYDPQLVHSFLFHANIAARLVCRFSGVPAARLLCEIQTVEIERRWHLKVDRWTRTLCRYEIGNSQAVIDHLHKQAGIEREQLKLIHGSVDVERFVNAAALPRESLRVGSQDHLLLWTGRLDAAKGLFDLLEATAILTRNYPIHVLLAGSGELENQLIHRIAELQIQGRVTLLGVRHDIERLLKTCDVFVFPSHTEGLPNALLEAMAAGCAIVCTSIASHCEILDGTDAAVMVPPGQPECLADAIGPLLDDPARRAALGKAANACTRNRFAPDAMYKRYLKLYTAAISGGRHS